MLQCNHVHEAYVLKSEFIEEEDLHESIYHSMYSNW